jgi:hypothetical protein
MSAQTSLVDSDVRQFVGLETDHRLGVLGVIMQDVVLDLVVVREPQLAVRALVRELIHVSIVRPGWRRDQGRSTRAGGTLGAGDSTIDGWTLAP